MGQIILASASPRRKELLEQIGLEFEICPAKSEEVISKTIPEEVVMELSEQKAKEVAAMVKSYELEHADLTTPQDLLVIGADTVVACDDKSSENRRMKLMQRGCYICISGRDQQFIPVSPSCS